MAAADQQVLITRTLRWREITIGESGEGAAELVGSCAAGRLSGGRAGCRPKAGWTAAFDNLAALVAG